MAIANVIYAMTETELRIELTSDKFQLKINKRKRGKFTSKNEAANPTMEWATEISINLIVETSFKFII